jgi:hypothetical protein
MKGIQPTADIQPVLMYAVLLGEFLWGKKKGSYVKKKHFKRVLQVVLSDRWKLCNQTVVGQCCLHFLASCSYPAMVGCDSLNKIPYLTMVRYRIQHVNSHRVIYLYLTLIIYFHNYIFSYL